jgi:hypothetical protein
MQLVVHVAPAAKTPEEQSTEPVTFVKGTEQGLTDAGGGTFVVGIILLCGKDGSTEHV